MANNKYAGYTPKKEELGMGNRLDRINPFEFRKGMDYELTAVGCSRLAESTIEEREKATETVLKNLDGNGGYYTSIITYETLFRNKIEGITKPSFSAWLKEQDINKMQEVKPGDKDSKHKEDKMIELKEAIKRRIKSKLREAKKDKDEDDVAFDDGEEVDVKKKADKAGKNIEKGMARFEDEKKAIDELLFGEAVPLSDKQRAKGDKETSEQNPAEGSLLHRKNANLEIYKQDKDVDNYKALIKLDEKEIKALEDHIETFGIEGAGNNVKLDMVKGDDLPSTIKKLQARKTSINKEVADETARMGDERNEIASTDMTRADQLRLLEICKANGVSLREGTDSIKHYYEIAKTCFLEGLAKGMKL
jgi:hypothetical protein